MRVRRPGPHHLLLHQMCTQARELGLTQICPRAHTVTPGLVRRLHAEGFVVRAWGVADEALMRQVVAATYHQLWWPPHDEPVYTGDQLPVWNDDGGGYCDPTTDRAASAETAPGGCA
jgi:hypothetical protein